MWRSLPILRWFLPPKWFRIAFVYGDMRPSDDDFWAMLGHDGQASEWPFRELAEWQDVGIHPFDDMLRTFLVGFDAAEPREEVELWITELIGDPACIGAISGPQTGFVVSFESPDDVRGCAPTARERAAFERLVRALAAVHERFGAHLYSMGEPALSIDDALVRIARAIENQ